MKLTLIDPANNKKGDAQVTVNERVRPDLIKRAVLALQSRARQPYGADPRAGLKHSTRMSRRRRKFRGSYGLGISRVPRKALSKKGRRIYWVGAEAPGTVGGRRAHPPKADKKFEKRINRKENRKAINSALAAAMDKAVVQERGHIVPDSYPFALAADFEKLAKTKEVRDALEKIGFADDLARGKNGAKSLLIVTEDETFTKAAKNVAGVDVCTAAEMNAELLAPGTHPGRATLLCESSIAVLNGDAPQAATKPAKTAKKAKAKKSAKKAAKKPAKKAAKEADA